MIAVLQRVRNASVSVDDEEIGACGQGFLILLGIAREDDEEDARLLADKIAKLRVFSDENGKMNRSLADIQGDLLIVSQFTLLASYAHGNRPDFLNAAPPDQAIPLYETFISLMRERQAGTSGTLATGRFGADMQVSLQNDGPVTIVMDSRVLRRK